MCAHALMRLCASVCVVVCLLWTVALVIVKEQSMGIIIIIAHPHEATEWRVRQLDDARAAAEEMEVADGDGEIREGIQGKMIKLHETFR